MILIGLFLSLAWSTTMVHSFYYQNYQAIPIAAMYADESSPYAAVLAQQRSDNVYNNEPQWTPYPYPTEAMLGQASNNRMVMQSENGDNICQGGFVEHCLVQANQDGEQRLLETSAANNQTGNSEREALSREFDGMCQVVIRFIDCINVHHTRCNPSSQTLQNIQADVFYNSWTNMCAKDSKIRNKYLQHAKCIRHALSHNNGQEQCQALFQSYFMSSQFAMDSIESTVQHGCCAFNEWQYCIDSLIHKQCGPDGTKAIQDLIDQASGGLVTSLCDKKTFGRKSKACIGKKQYNYNKLQTLDPQMNATLQKYISIFGDFIDRLPDDDDDEETPNSK